LVRKPTRSEIINTWRSDNIQFISGTRADENYDEDIASIVAFNKEYPDAYIHISGYSDSSGSEASNMRVSERRAKKVYDSLVKAGVPADMMTYEGYGESNPVADNGTKEGRLINRRVEVSASTVKRVIEKVGVKR
jgi:outer membrane protein OmpA-like peptidoglycan-associated protein